MKKLLALVLVAGMVAFVSCGPSKKDKEKEKAKTDSITAAKKAKDEADSLVAVEKDQHRKDSLKMDSMAKAKPKGGYYGGGQQQQQPKQQQQAKPKINRPGATKKN